MPITQPPRSLFKKARKLLFALALVTCWCFVVIEFAGVALYQGVALGVTTAWPNKVRIAARTAVRMLAAIW